MTKRFIVRRSQNNGRSDRYYVNYSKGVGVVEMGIISKYLFTKRQRFLFRGMNLNVKSLLSLGH